MAALRWGVLGVSALAGRLAVLPALRASASAELVAIASRDPARAEAEAVRFGARRSYGTYEGLLRDPDIEAIYIPLPNALHREWTLRAAAAGKHVLCEKPLACTAMEAREMAEACEKAGVLLLEAYMTHFHARHRAALEMALSGRLGRLQFIRSAFTFPANDPQNHRWLLHMGGGSLLDVGVYCLAPVLALASGAAQALAALSWPAPDGVDSAFSGWLAFEDGLTAAFQTSFRAAEEQTLEIIGTQGRLRIERAFTAGPADDGIELVLTDGSIQVVSIPGNNPYQTMVEHFAEVVRGKTAPARTTHDSILTLDLIDRLRSAAVPRQSL